MTKSEFLAQLRRRISNQPPEEIERSISYFSEIIDDRMEDGMDEQEAVSSLGSIDTIVWEMLPNDSELKLGSYPAREVSSVRIRDINCAVILECSDGDVISLDYYENKHKKYEIFLSPEGELSVRSKYSKMRFFGFNAFRPFVLRMPRSYRGKISLETGNGPIRAKDVNIEGSFSVKTSNGVIDIIDVSIEGMAEIRTSNARIYLENLTASHIRAKTMNGRIDAISTRAKNTVSLQTMNGRIHVERLYAEKGISLVTSNAGIHGTIDDNIRTFSIKSRTMNGNSTLPSNMDGGTKDLSVHTMNGNIDLHFLK